MAKIEGYTKKNKTSIEDILAVLSLVIIMIFTVIFYTKDRDYAFEKDTTDTNKVITEEGYNIKECGNYILIKTESAPTEITITMDGKEFTEFDESTGSCLGDSTIAYYGYDYDKVQDKYEYSYIIAFEADTGFDITGKSPRVYAYSAGELFDTFYADELGLGVYKVDVTAAIEDGTDLGIGIVRNLECKVLEYEQIDELEGL